MKLKALYILSLTIPTIILILYFFNSFKKSFHKNKKKIRIIIFNRRLNKVRNFEKLSEMIMKDILEALKTENNSHEQAKALLPLLLDIRKTGEKLLAQQHFYHTVLFPSGEARIKPRVERLIHVEKLLKSLPRKGVSSENLYEKSQ
ncbi:hypothetical protein [Silvanigrella aquatica]|uniref:hypothetical protein n=1 Tax=Silvanigrella aquatica TaxID=1915309 RepID=UPI0011E5B02D|nr:hypothetical protein [Silvanigrella aquatica]